MFMPEGPFGEWTGYYASNQPAVPVIQVKAVYHRNDPILCGFPLLKPSSGDNLHFSLMRLGVDLERPRRSRRARRHRRVVSSVRRQIS